jgi:hypothetical protein
VRAGTRGAGGSAAALAVTLPKWHALGDHPAVWHFCRLTRRIHSCLHAADGLATAAICLALDLHVVTFQLSLVNAGQLMTSAIYGILFSAVMKYKPGQRILVQSTLLVCLYACRHLVLSRIVHCLRHTLKSCYNCFCICCLDLSVYPGDKQHLLLVWGLVLLLCAY